MDIVTWSSVEETERHPGHHRKQKSFDTCFFALHRYLPDGEGYDLHSHPELQAGAVVDGEMAMIFPAGPATVGPGEVYVIPGDLRHGGKGTGATEAKVLNLYVKPELLAGTSSEVRLEDWSPDAGASLSTDDITLQRIELRPGEAPEAVEAAAEVIDVVLRGEAEVQTAEGARPLGRLDAVRWGGVPDPARPVTATGPQGASVLRFIVPGQREGL